MIIMIQIRRLIFLLDNRRQRQYPAMINRTFIVTFKHIIIISFTLKKTFKIDVYFLFQRKKYGIHESKGCSCYTGLNIMDRRFVIRPKNSDRTEHC